MDRNLFVRPNNFNTIFISSSVLRILNFRERKKLTKISILKLKCFIKRRQYVYTKYMQHSDPKENLRKSATKKESWTSPSQKKYIYHSQNQVFRPNFLTVHFFWNIFSETKFAKECNFLPLYCIYLFEKKNKFALIRDFRFFLNENTKLHANGWKDKYNIGT